MNILSLHNKSLLKGNELANEKLQNLNGVKKNGDKEENKGEISFKDMISKEINKVNESQLKADDMTNKFMTGEIDDLHSVMISTEEARINLELAVQMRNKCIEAFKEINNMQL